jgi:hypothetical protein
MIVGAACGDDDGVAVDAGFDSAVDGGSRDGGVEPDAPAVDADRPDVPEVDAGPSCVGDPALDPLTDTPRFAVILSDYSSTAVAMLGSDGTILEERWIDSGTELPGLVATLSGDVALPTRQPGDGSFVLLDRFRTDVVSRFCSPSGALVGQVRTHGPGVSESFSSNPHDLVVDDAGRAWVTRFEPNLDPAAAEIDRGTDLFELDLTTMLRTDRRIDLSSLDVTVPIGRGDVVAHARPSRVVRVGSTAIVGLARLSLAFDAAGEGAVANVDLTTGSVEAVSFGALRSCGNVSPVPGRAGAVLVACGGFANPFGDEPMRRASSGLVLLDVADGVVSVARRWNASDHPDEPIAVQNAIALDERHVLAASWGNFAPPSNDQLLLIDLETGDVTFVGEGGGAFVLGAPAFDPSTNTVLLPEAGVGLRRFAWSAGTLTEGSASAIGDALGLPARSVALLP